MGREGRWLAERLWGPDRMNLGISLARARAELIYFIYHSCYLLARPESSCRDLRSEQQHDRDTDRLDAYGAARRCDYTPYAARASRSSARSAAWSCALMSSVIRAAVPAAAPPPGAGGAARARPTRRRRRRAAHRREQTGEQVVAASMSDDRSGRRIGTCGGRQRAMPLEAADHGHKGGGGRGWWMRVVAGRVHVHTAALQRRLCVLDDFFWLRLWLKCVVFGRFRRFSLYLTKHETCPSPTAKRGEALTAACTHRCAVGLAHQSNAILISG